MFSSARRPLPSSSPQPAQGWYDSHGDNNTDGKSMSAKKTAAASSKTRFEDIPINKSVLQYIQTIGVGIQPKKKRTLKRKGKHSKGRSGAMDDGIILLNENAERDFLMQKDNAAKRSEREARHEKSEKAAQKEAEKARRLSSWWLPPPPFASNDNIAGIDDVTEQGHTVRRLPVKVLGTAASKNDNMPRSSKGLPEVALAGRSNVGKSTLLNALLYGNQPSRDGSPMTRQRSRGRTPEGAKLQKGIKAAVSNRPGETRAITLYQLTSQILFPDVKGAGEQKAKMSLVLADLPGYGFAYASDQKADEWRDLMRHYILERGSSLKRVLLLIDARHGMKPADINFLRTLQDALRYSSSKSQRREQLPPIQLVLTKCDLVGQKDLARRVVQVREQLSDNLRREPSSLPVMLVSAKAGLGFNNVRGDKARGGVLELQKDVAAIVPYPSTITKP